MGADHNDMQSSYCSGAETDTNSYNYSTRDNLFEKALSYHQQGKEEEALLLYEQVLEIDSEYVEAWFYGALLLSSTGQNDKALPWFERAQDLEPSHAAIVYQLGVCQHSLGKKNLAITSFKKVLKLDDAHWQAAYNLGAVYYSSGDTLKSIEAYSVAARLNPEDADIQFNLAIAYKKAGDFESARLSYSRALQIMPEDADIYYNLGRLYDEMDYKDDAITSFEIAIALEPDFGPALSNLGVLYCSRELFDKAIPIYEKLIEIDHNPVAAGHILDALNGNTSKSAPLEYVKQLYDKFAGHFEDRLLNDLCYSIPEKLVNLLNEYNGGEQSCQHMLDLGCGTGLCGEAFSASVHSITGVDLSANMIKKAGKKGVYDKLFEGDVVSFLEDETSQYDLIVAGDVFIYLGDLKKVFQFIPKILSEQGRILLSTEKYEDQGYILRPSGRYAHSISYINNLAVENNLQILAVESVNTRKENDRWIAGDIYLMGHA